MKRKASIETVTLTEFKASCQSRIERVRRTGRRIVITKKGEPIAEVVPASKARATSDWLGSAAGTVRILGDIVSPVVNESEWEALKD